MIEDLLLCPFCGGEADVRGHQAPEYWVGCPRIGCKATTEGFGDMARAIAAWNTRAPIAGQAELVEALPEAPSEDVIRAVDKACHEKWPNARKMAVALYGVIRDAALAAHQPRPHSKRSES